MKELYLLHIKGKTKEWCIEIEAEQSWVNDWEDDGLVIRHIRNMIPHWWVNMGFSVKTWCFFQDILNFNNPFAK
jgi:hypothetical protein